MNPSILIMLLVPTLLLALSGCGSLNKVAQHNKAGVELHREGRFQETIAEFDEAILIDSEAFYAWYNRGIAYVELGQAQRGIEDFDEAIHLNPEFALAYAHRALAYTFLRKDAEAERDVERAVELGIDSTPVRRDIEKIKSQR